MTIEQKRKVLKKIVAIESDIEALKKCRIEVAASGYASASLASAGGSKSYTRTDISKLTETIAQLSEELKAYRALVGGSESCLPKTIWTVYI